MKLIATIAAALVAAATLAPASAHAVEPTRVLIVGDSVTQGKDGDYSWRYFAWESLQRSGASVDFVGPNAGTHLAADTWGGSYAEPDFDTDHASRWGMAMVEMLDWDSPTAPRIETLVAAHTPDVVVEQLGVNDFAWGGLSVDRMMGQVRRFVADARSVNPDVDVVLGSLPQTWIEQVPAFNAALPSLAAELSTEGSRVVATPVAEFVQGVDTYDFAHPTTLGQRKIAEAVTGGLEALGVGRAMLMPDPSQVEPEPAPELEVVIDPELIAPPAVVEVPPSVTPQPVTVVTVVPEMAAPVAPSSPRKVRATAFGKRVVVTWRKASGAERYSARCSREAKVVTRSKAVLRAQAKSCRVRSVNEAGVSRWVKVRVRN